MNEMQRELINENREGAKNTIQHFARMLSCNETLEIPWKTLKSHLEAGSFNDFTISDRPTTRWKTPKKYVKMARNYIVIGRSWLLFAGRVGRTHMDGAHFEIHPYFSYSLILQYFATFLKSTKNIWVLILQQYNNGTQGPIYQEPQQELSLQSCLFTIIHHCSLLLCSHNASKTQRTNKYNTQTNSGHNRINLTQLTHSM